jgi:hypothetical protein
MKTLGTALMLLGGSFIGIAHYWFLLNTRGENHDQMGASISFDQMFFVGALLIAIGIGLAGLLAWYWCIILFFGLEGFSLLYKWLFLDKVMELFRRPNSK